MAETSEPEVLLERRGSAGVITLNRPKALNALTHGMVRAIAPRLNAWAEDPAVTRIVVMGAGDRAFCAGGDIRALYDLGRAGRAAEAKPFWREEYILNHRLKTYPKPVVALIDGIVMGGGVGMSLHGSHRAASDKLTFAMPEVGIGFFPDVGASWFLPRLPDRIGAYLALTGARIGLGDALALGLVTHPVAAGRAAAIAEALAGRDDVDSVLARFAAPAPDAPLLARHAEIAALFDGDTVGAIIGRLAAAASPFAAETLATMRSKSPTSMAIALEQMKRGATLSFAEAMRMEYRIVCRIAEGEDFYEGVRAVIVDKDQQPAWRPSRIEDVDPAAVARHFAPLADDLDLG
jgi:enoyl-CoA hydratase